MHLSLETSTLEMAYDKACRQVEMVCESENARQLRLQTLLLEDENDELHTQLAQADRSIDELENYITGLQEDVDATMGKLDSVQGDLRIRNREIETLKVIDNVMLRREQGLISAIGGTDFPLWGYHEFNETAYGEAHARTGAVGPQTRNRSLPVAGFIFSIPACGEIVFATTIEHFASRTREREAVYATTCC